MFITALFKIAKTWKQPKCPLPEEWIENIHIHSGIFTSSSVAHSCLILCDAMNCSTPGFPVHHQPPDFTQTHVHWVVDAIQTSLPLSSPSPPALIFPSIRVFSNELAPHNRWPKYWSFNFSISPSSEHPGLISFRKDWLELLAAKGLSTVTSSGSVTLCSY